jgi:hypothetical protein
MDKNKFFEIVNSYISKHSLILLEDSISLDELYEKFESKDSPIDFLNKYFTLPKKNKKDKRSYIEPFKICFPELDFSTTFDGKFLNKDTYLQYQAFIKTLKFREKREVSLFFSSTYGWSFEGNEEFRFPDFNSKKGALNWANKNGFFVVAEID